MSRSQASGSLPMLARASPIVPSAKVLARCQVRTRRIFSRLRRIAGRPLVSGIKANVGLRHCALSKCRILLHHTLFMVRASQARSIAPVSASLSAALEIVDGFPGAHPSLLGEVRNTLVRPTGTKRLLSQAEQIWLRQAIEPVHGLVVGLFGPATSAFMPSHSIRPI